MGVPSSVRMVSNVMNVDAIYVYVMRMLSAKVMTNAHSLLLIVNLRVPTVNVSLSVESPAT